MHTFTAEVSSVRALTHDVRQIDLRLLDPGEIRFAPGQFVSFEIPQPGAPYPLTRAYSIASSPHRAGEVSLLVNQVGSSGGSAYLFSLAPGDRTAFRGPAGAFTLQRGPRELLFVATGTGVAPIRSMLWWLAETEPARPVTLFWGLRSDRDVYLGEELERLRRRLTRFTVEITLSQPSAAWTGAVGHVGRLVEQQCVSVDRVEAFLCGNRAMIAEVSATLRRRGLCPIRTEQYYNDLPRVAIGA